MGRGGRGSRGGASSTAVRISGGRLRGRALAVPPVAAVRPTAARVREALFSMLGQNLHGVSVLDLFGGAGLLAFEAASRGAGPITVVERDPRVARAIAANARSLGLSIELRQGDAAAVDTGEWDLVLLDPPYADPPERWLRHAAPRAGWRLVIEHDAGPQLPAAPGAGHQLLRSRRYGRTAVSVYGRAPAGVAEAEVVGEDAGVVEGEAEPRG